MGKHLIRPKNAVRRLIVGALAGSGAWPAATKLELAAVYGRPWKFLRALVKGAGVSLPAQVSSMSGDEVRAAVGALGNPVDWSE